MLSPSGSVPASTGDASRLGEPLDFMPAVLPAGRLPQSSDVSKPREGHRETVSTPLIPNSSGNIRQNPRPRSLAESSLDTPTSLQRHFHHQRHQSGSDLRPSSSLSSTINGPDGSRLVDMPLTGDSRAAQSPTSRGILSGWLPGSPAETARARRSRGSISLSPGMTPSKTPRTQPSQQTTPTGRATASPDGSGSRFGFISSSLSALTRSGATQSPSRETADDEDELFSLNIEQALFPPASPGGTRDPFSPASYKNLEMAATSLLASYQQAYRRQKHEILELRMDREAKDEEIEENDTRTRHLKLQLEDLARQAAEREQEMQALIQALEKERKLNREMASGGFRLPPPPHSDTATVVSEDLGAEEDQKHPQWRKSHNFEDTDEESESVGDAPSVFSRSRSPTFVAGPHQTKAAPPVHQQQQMNAFQKLVKGITGDADTGASSQASCRNCHGQDGQMAWDTVGVLRDENRTLKVRVAELERCVEGALDAVNGLRL